MLKHKNTLAYIAAVLSITAVIALPIIGNFKSNFKQLYYITFCQGVYIRKQKGKSILPQFDTFNEFNDKNLQSIQKNDFILMHGFQFNRNFYRNKASKYYIFLVILLYI